MREYTLWTIVFVAAAVALFMTLDSHGMETCQKTTTYATCVHSGVGQ